MSKMYQRAIVTGATSGIGAAAVRALCGAGIQTLAIGRRRQPLDALAAETGAQILAADIGQIEEVAGPIADFDPDVVVNNAGVGHGITGLASVSSADIAQAVQVNVTALIQITALA
ncbi:MAG: SDR family NAD(P)-dependent oxidoreductase, partial [Pseudomonadota bacterium]